MKGSPNRRKGCLLTAARYRIEVAEGYFLDRKVGMVDGANAATVLSSLPAVYVRRIAERKYWTVEVSILAVSYGRINSSTLNKIID